MRLGDHHLAVLIEAGRFEGDDATVRPGIRLRLAAGHLVSVQRYSDDSLLAQKFDFVARKPEQLPVHHFVVGAERSAGVSDDAGCL